MPASGGRRAKYLAFVAHEIKNPLATALWSCDLLKRMDAADRSGERATKMIDVSLRALRRMRRLVDDYFTIERLQENAYDLAREKLPLRQLVQGALEALAEKDGIASEGWAIELADGAPIACDGDLLRRALRALFEHMARGGNDPQLSIQSRDGALHIQAQTPPTPLIPPEPDERRSGEPLGTVLGFSLAASVIEGHGGRIEERDGGLLVTLPAA
jgi:signal transduction histidine kinase